MNLQSDFVTAKKCPTNVLSKLLFLGHLTNLVGHCPCPTVICSPGRGEKIVSDNSKFIRSSEGG